MFDCGTLRISNPKTLQRWFDLGWYQKKINDGLIFNPYCGRFTIEECVCTKCRNKREDKQELIKLIEQFKKKYMENLKKQFIPYEQALALKELGFDEKCLSYPMSNTDASGRTLTSVLVAPLYQQAFRWFREKYNIDFSIITNYAKVDSKMIKSYRVGFIIVKNNIIDSYFLRPENNKLKFIEFSTFEEAELECLNELIKIVKNK